ncbi:MAG: dTDP-4-dehydrorhamnose reductase [Parcubacteria group bacterium Gr01-1014_31]|nr:MAG: dTDP-4-dehydrorhamnose reductase [Parcubacteria group bacterium Gr01-1014_31]
MKTGKVNPAALPVAIIGAQGMLGRELVAVLQSQGLPVCTLDLPEFDLTDHDHVVRRLKGITPRYVINAAAYTDVDGCEENAPIAYAINAEAVGVLAQTCRDIGAALVHYSTDYVFDGADPAGYAENAVPNPLSVYGKSKLEGERLLRQSSCRYLLIRTSWLFGPGRRDNVVEKIITRAKRDGKLKLVNDRWGKPTYAADLATKTVALMVAGDDEEGIHHLTNDTPTTGITWYEFGKEIMKLLGLDTELEACSSAEFPQKAMRPVHSLLVNTKELPLRSWREALADYLREVHPGQ